MCFCSVRSKRNRRGPVIEADGMLKMFHCPYEGCSQVYVAISSYQVKFHSYFIFQLQVFFFLISGSLLSVESCQPSSQEGEDQGLPPSRLWEKVLSVKPPASPHDHPFRWAHRDTHMPCSNLFRTDKRNQVSSQGSEISSVRRVENHLSARITWRFTGGPTQEKHRCSELLKLKTDPVITRFTQSAGLKV